MYLRHLRIQNLKLLKDLSLSFTNEHGEPRMWTVIIGENGTGKTSILQAIAMAAAGGLNVNGLVENVSSLPDKRAPESKVFIPPYSPCSRWGLHPVVTAPPSGGE